MRKHTHGRYSRDVTRIQQRFAVEGAASTAFHDESLRDPRTLRVFLTTLLADYEPALEVLDRLRSVPDANEMMMELLAETGLGERLFDDDTLFTSQRFNIVTGWGSIAGSNRPLFDRVMPQLLRMYAAGRADPHYMTHMAYWANGNEDIEVTATILAHDDGLREVFYGRNVLGRDMPASVVAAADAADALRVRYFNERWLPAVLPAGAATGMGNVAAPLLREIYPALWARGYTAYHEHVMATMGRT